MGHRRAATKVLRADSNYIEAFCLSIDRIAHGAPLIAWDRGCLGKKKDRPEKVDPDAGGTCVLMRCTPYCGMIDVGNFYRENMGCYFGRWTALSTTLKAAVIPPRCLAFRSQGSITFEGLDQA